jgi:hypothetical protein
MRTRVFRGRIVDRTKKVGDQILVLYRNSRDNAGKPREADLVSLAEFLAETRSETRSTPKGGEDVL